MMYFMPVGPVSKGLKMPITMIVHDHLLMTFQFIISTVIERKDRSAGKCHKTTCTRKGQLLNSPCFHKVCYFSWANLVLSEDLDFCGKSG